MTARVCPECGRELRSLSRQRVYHPACRERRRAFYESSGKVEALLEAAKRQQRALWRTEHRKAA